MKISRSILSTLGLVLAIGIGGSTYAADSSDSPTQLTYPIIDTGMTRCYDNTKQIDCPNSGEAFYGQDGSYQGLQPAYKDNGDGTVTDLNTGLMWQKTTAAKSDSLDGRMTWYEGEEHAKNLKLGGHTDWRVPSVKELISIVDANGVMGDKTPYFDGDYFDFSYGPENIDGYRWIDVQVISSTSYISTSVLFSDWWVGFDEKEIEPGKMYRAPSFLSYNFSDGRIKSYPKEGHPYLGTPTWVFRGVRGPAYGQNNFVDNGDGTISDLATGLMWQKADDGKTRNWEESLAYAENLQMAGHSDWRLPNQKELHSIVDYGYIPAIDPIFYISDPKAWFWSSTPFIDMVGQAVYIAFGKATGKISASPEDEYDVHGAGAMRSDPVAGDPDCCLEGRGPQNDTIRIYNYSRAVRTIDPRR